MPDLPTFADAGIAGHAGTASPRPPGREDEATAHMKRGSSSNAGITRRRVPLAGNPGEQPRRYSPGRPHMMGSFAPAGEPGEVKTGERQPTRRGRLSLISGPVFHRSTTTGAVTHPSNAGAPQRPIRPASKPRAHYARYSGKKLPIFATFVQRGRGHSRAGITRRPGPLAGRMESSSHAGTTWPRLLAWNREHRAT